MLSDWLWILAFGAIFVAVQSLPTGVADDAKKDEQPLRPKGTLSNSGLDDSLTETAEDRAPQAQSLQQQPQQQLQQEQQQQQQQQPLSGQPKQESYGLIMDQPVAMPQQEKTYEYGKVLVNEMGDVMPRGVWDLPAYGRYYGIAAVGEDRRKRSEDAQAAKPSAAAAAAAASQSAALASQPKRSIPAYYQEPRYKRELDIDPEDLFTLLSYYDNERRNRGNWRYGNDEYDNVDDVDTNVIGIDEEDPRVAQWLDSALGYPQQQQQQQQQHRYVPSDQLLSSELAALSAGRQSLLPNYYDQYLGQYGGDAAAAAGQQYDTAVQYGTPQYMPQYVQHAYYPPEKRFMVSRKRSANYDSYGRSGLLMNSRGYPNYQHRLLY